MGPLDLPIHIDKFLKYMDFIKSSSTETLRAYRVDLAQAYPPAAIETPMDEDGLLALSRGAFEAWKELSLSSRNRKAATLKSFLGWLFREGLTAQNLAEKIHCPKVPLKIPHFLSVDEALAVLQCLDREAPAAERALIYLLYGGGLRVSEACGLKWTHFDPDARIVRVRGKGAKERLVPLPHKCCEVLAALRSESEFVFGTTALSPRVAYNWVRAWGAKAGLHQHLHPHALRHSYATHMLAGGANLRTLQELLGHESLRATEKYTHLTLDQLARSMEKAHPFGALRKKTG